MTTPIIIDFETYYDKEYSLKKITMEEYIRDERFECIGLSIKVNDDKTEFYRGESWITPLKSILSTHKDHVIVSHNAMFDMGILGLRYDIHPRNLGDTMLMSAVVGLDRCAGRASLDALSQYLISIGYDMPSKGDYVANMEGVHLSDMDETDWERYGEYCIVDSEICATMYKIMLPFMPAGEMGMISTTLKMFTNPSVKLDTELLEDYQQRLIQKREDLLAGVARKVGLSGADELAPHLRSTAKFAKLLESVGVTAPTKYSEKQDKMIPAVSKTDHEFLELVASEDELTRTLCEARLGAASNLEMTRCKRFIDISRRGLMPVPLRYASAHTGRYGGSDKINLQNLPKRKGDKSLRRSITAPNDHVIIATDSSQIECLAGDSLVLTDTGLKRIDNISIADLLWDGVEWVHHDGVIYKGVKDVINYAGITGTPNHIVYTRDGRKLTLDEAAASGEELAVGEREGKPIRTLDSVGKTHTSNGGAEGVDAMPMWRGETNTDIRFEVGKIKELQSVWASEVFGYTGATSQSTAGAVQCVSGTVQGKQVQQSHLQECEKRFQQLRTFCSLRLGKLPSRRLSESRNRSDRYERPLCTRQHTACDQRGECPNTGYERNHQIQGSGNKCLKVCTRLCKKVWRRLGSGTNTQGTYRPANIKFSTGKKASVFGIRRGEVLYRVVREKVRRKLRSVSHIEETTQRYTERGNLIAGTVAVYDIINAGSRNRFCCNGIIVSNCRILAHAAQELPLINIFLNKDDPYSDMASNIYGLPYEVIYREAKIERTKEGIVRRNVGKTTELGCIAEGTEVLTDRGWVQIQHIQNDDLLWDGDEFVPHEGLLDKGFRPCVKFNNIALTPDHKIYNHISGRWFTVEEILYYTDLSLLADTIADSCNQYSFHDIPSKYRRYLVEARDNKLGINDFVTRPILKTYDILNVGTKNCFYVRSINKGSGSSVLKVHNCGYGMGADKFEGQLKLDGLLEAAGNAREIVQAYRRARPNIVRFWKTCGDVLDIMLTGGRVSFGGPNNDLFVADGSTVFWDKKIPSVRLPNGTYIWYQNLRKVPRQEPAQFGDGMEFVYDQFKGNRFEMNRIYGGKLTENLIQGLAFAVLKYQALQMVNAGVPVHMNVHDEWVSIVPKSMAHHAVAVHTKAMRTVPDYIPQGLLDMELDMGKNYADTTTIGGL